jgi:hypothetical protein
MTLQPLREAANARQQALSLGLTSRIPSSFVETSDRGVQSQAAAGLHQGTSHLHRVLSVAVAVESELAHLEQTLNFVLMEHDARSVQMEALNNQLLHAEGRAAVRTNIQLTKPPLFRNMKITCILTRCHY